MQLPMIMVTWHFNIVTYSLFIIYLSYSLTTKICIYCYIQFISFVYSFFTTYYISFGSHKYKVACRTTEMKALNLKFEMSPFHVFHVPLTVPCGPRTLFQLRTAWSLCSTRSFWETAARHHGSLASVQASLRLSKRLKPYRPVPFALWCARRPHVVLVRSSYLRLCFDSRGLLPGLGCEALHDFPYVLAPCFNETAMM